jgi:uncharacterized protein YgiB involved in biofilm formation
MHREKYMKNWLLALVVIAQAATVSIAGETEKETKEDTARHRSMAQAHLAAAKCLEAGTPADVCNKALQDACQGLAIGRFCGMKHAH